MSDRLEEEFREPFTAWKQNPSPQTSTRMLQAVRPVLDTAVRNYGQNIPTLKGRAKSIALDALGSYDSSRGTLKNHLMMNLQRLHRDAMQSRQIIQAPERVLIDQARLHSAQVDFEDQFGRPPSDQELSDHAAIPLTRIRHVRRASRPLAEGQVTREPTGDDADEFSPATSSLQHDYRPLLQFVYEDLTPTDQFILERLEGMHGHPPHPPGEVARLLKISPAAVSQRIARIQAHIDQVMKLEGTI